MASFVEIPVERLEPEVLAALLEEYATRDGTDYGEVETSVMKRVQQLQTQLERGELVLAYDADSEQWDLLNPERAAEFLTQ